MALSKQVFTRAGAAPDLPTLTTAIRTVIGDPFYLSAPVAGGVVTVVVEKPTAWAAPDIVAVQAAVTAAPTATAQIDAQNAIDAMSIFDKAIVLTIIDQLNIIRAALPAPLGAITVNQAIAAVRAKAGTL